MPNYKETVKKKIIKHINQKSIAGFLVNEIESNLSFFNPFRLENIMENIGIFAAFINELDTHNTNLYINSDSSLRFNKISDKKNLLTYQENKYISQSGRETLSINEQKDFNKLTSTEKNQNTTLIK